MTEERSDRLCQDKCFDKCFDFDVLFKLQNHFEEAGRVDVEIHLRDKLNLLKRLS